jgi:glyceraldehyde 3-phosphate dehydrogenase
MVRVAINGFGRIGRMVIRAGIDDPDIIWVAVNDLSDPKDLAYLFKYDTTQGIFSGTVEAKANSLVINGKEIKVLSEKEPEKLPWKKLNIDVVVESTGFFTNKKDAMKHITAGAKKVLVSAPCKCDAIEQPVKTVVKGVNEHTLTKNDIIVSNASCTTNCLAPMVKVMHDNYRVKRGLMTTVHSYTADQKLVDAPHKDPRRGRSAAENIVITTTGAAKSVTEVIPELKGKLDGFSLRVPTPTGSFTDFVCEIEKSSSVDEINRLFKSVAEHELKGVVGYTEDMIVSSDIVGNPNSCIFDPSFTKIIGGNFVKIGGWYDNEYGYSVRMVDLLKIMHRLG